MHRETSGSSLEEGPILLYDGDCGVCTRTVRFVLRRDRRRGTVRFASLQGELAGAIRSRHRELDSVDSMVWVIPRSESSPERVRVRSDAVISAGLYLGGVWGAIAQLARMVPRVLRDGAYDAFARVRRRIPGIRQACSLPTSEERARFLDP